MKTTDSVMREKFEDKFGMCFQPFGEKLDEAKDFLSHSLAEARREWVEEMRVAVQDCMLMGDEDTDDLVRLDDVLDLLTGDNPERKV